MTSETAAELEDMEQHIPWLEQQLATAIYNLEQQQGHAAMVYGESWERTMPAGSHHAISLLQAKVDEITARLAGCRSYRDELAS